MFDLMAFCEQHALLCLLLIAMQPSEPAEIALVTLTTRCLLLLGPSYTVWNKTSHQFRLKEYIENQFHREKHLSSLAAFIVLKWLVLLSLMLALQDLVIQMSSQYLRG